MKITKEQREELKSRFGEMQLKSLSLCELISCDMDCKQCPVGKMQKKIVSVKTVLMELPLSGEEEDV